MVSRFIQLSDQDCAVGRTDPQINRTEESPKQTHMNMPDFLQSCVGN